MKHENDSQVEYRANQLARAAIAKEVCRMIPQHTLEAVIQARHKLDEAQKNFRREVELATREFVQSAL